MDSAKKTNKLFGSSEFISDSLLNNKSTRIKKDKRAFSTLEEILHAITHGAGAALAILATVLLAIKTAPMGALELIGSVLFGASLIILYSSSCAYHTACAMYPDGTKSKVREITKKFDHCCIFLLITGTYIPACWTALGGALGWTVFAVVAACCVFGFILNTINVERFKKISLILYIITGWAIALASVPYAKAIGITGFLLLLFGGISYTIGIVFYKIQRVPYFHVMWHFFVLGGSVLHFLMVYFYCY